MRLTEANRTTLNSFLVRESFPVIAENVEEAQLRTLLTTAKNNETRYILDTDTAIHKAARLGNIDIINIILNCGIDVNQARTDGVTPLYIAAALGQLDVAKLLLDRGAKVNKARTSGATPLYITELFCANTSVTLLLKLSGAKRGAIDFDTNDEVIKQALKASAMLEIITQRFPASATDLHRAIEATLDNITNIGNLLSFNQGLEKKFNKIIHPSSTADISHMVNQFLPGKLPDALIGKIANPEIENLAEHDLRGTKNTGAIVAQIITNRLQEQAVQALAQAAAEVVIARAQSKQNCSSNFADRVEKRAEKDSTQGR